MSNSPYWAWDDFWPYLLAMEPKLQDQAAIALDLENHLLRLGDESQVIVLRNAPDAVIAAMYVKGVIKPEAVKTLEKRGRIFLMPVGVISATVPPAPTGPGVKPHGAKVRRKAKV